MNKAEELIACLEGEIAKRDARIEAQEAQINILQSDANSWQSGYDEGRRMGAKHAAPVPEAKAQGVAMPGRSDERGSDGELTYEAKAHNRCLDEVARLNAAPVQHDSDCSTNNRGVPDLLGPCDCNVAPVQQVSVPAAIRYTSDGELAECPCCGSLDVGGAHDTVNCYGCGLQIKKHRPLQNAADAWNRRSMLAAAPAAPAADALYEAVTPDVVEWLRCGLAANNRLVDGTHPALERVREAIAAHRAKGVV